MWSSRQKKQQCLSRWTHPAEQEFLAWDPWTNFRVPCKRSSYSIHQISEVVLDPQENHHHGTRQSHILPSLILLDVGTNVLIHSYAHECTDTQPPNAPSVFALQPHQVPGDRLHAKARIGSMATWSAPPLSLPLSTDLALAFLFMLLWRGQNPYWTSHPSSWC